MVCGAPCMVIIQLSYRAMKCTSDLTEISLPRLAIEQSRLVEFWIHVIGSSLLPSFC